MIQIISFILEKAQNQELTVKFHSEDPLYFYLIDLQVIQFESLINPFLTY